MTYQIIMTPLAEAFARAKSTVSDVMHAAAEEIDSVCPADERPNGLFSFEVGDQLFVGMGRGDGMVMIDTASLEEGPVLKDGPFAGKRVMIPRPDSENR